jgi:predicted nucleic acid-binding protein
VILVDTSVWIDHLRSANASLAELLGEQQVLTHPFVMGEVACGSISNRSRILLAMQALPRAVVAEHDEVMRLIDDRKLWGKGIGWLDAHLLTSVLLSGSFLWTHDKPLQQAAAALRVRADS